jgi:hypothetical protein
MSRCTQITESRLFVFNPFPGINYTKSRGKCTQNADEVPGEVRPDKATKVTPSSLDPSSVRFVTVSRSTKSAILGATVFQTIIQDFSAARQQLLVSQ